MTTDPKDERTEPTPHNPDQLTPEQIGDGWRLLDRDEVSTPETTTWGGIENLEQYNRRWVPNQRGNDSGTSYRTKLTRAELRKARGLEPDRSPTHSALYTSACVARLNTQEHDKLIQERDSLKAALEKSDAKLAFLKSKGLTVAPMKSSDKPEPYLIYVIEPGSELSDDRTMRELTDEMVKRTKAEAALEKERAEVKSWKRSSENRLAENRDLSQQLAEAKGTLEEGVKVVIESQREINILRIQLRLAEDMDDRSKDHSRWWKKVEAARKVAAMPALNSTALLDELERAYKADRAWTAITAHEAWLASNTRQRFSAAGQSAQMPASVPLGGSAGQDSGAPG